MTDDDLGELIMTILMISMAMFVVISAIAIVLAAGFFLGAGIGLVNYGKAVQANVRLERPVIS